MQFPVSEDIFGGVEIQTGRVLLGSRKKVAVFHMLPSGGGIRVLRQFLTGLEVDFDLHLHRPEGGSPRGKGISLPETVYSYPLWKRPSGMLKPVAPLFLIARLLSFKKVCRKAADNINSSSDIALVHNSMPIAAPPVLDYLSIPSLYFCYEHPRHIYEKDIIRRTNSSLAEFALKPLTALEKRMDRNSVRNSSSVVTFSEYMKNNIDRYYSRESSIVRPGVDTAFFMPAQKKVQKSNYVISVGALWPFKGHETAIRILGLIPAAQRPPLRIVADREYPGYSQQLIQLAEALSVTISIEKMITDVKLRSLYQQAQAVLCCQRREPYGLVPMEAMACGTPVIALMEGGFIDNICHGETGFFFSGNPEEGAVLLAGILSAHELTENIISRGLEFVREKRSIAGGINQLKRVLQSL